jgi:hypothetical protein
MYDPHIQVDLKTFYIEMILKGRLGANQGFALQPDD